EPEKRTRDRSRLLFRQTTHTHVQRLRKTSRASVRRHGSEEELLMNAAGVMEHEPRDAQKRHVLASPSIPGSQFFAKRSLTQFLVNVLANKIFAFSVIIGVGFCLL